ncbi:NADPH-dependent FMN reductase [Yinghuangia soli]|uniref:NAD(P)H-dependent oxidoreductase n=1 Tax=Yinghuangia soli TaxID=2908204 RepID=A0AA41PXU2_9ACTN|nr:NAD(P)H-dependent oxidoreductase [Yinghuangia soli]MCF2527557.1 NAD(P)H-dependent oxidoreductase [Yinghuangia soli]
MHEGQEQGAALRLAVIVGSTREGRTGDKVAGWFAEHAAGRAGLAPTVIDLADFAFPARYPERPTADMAGFCAAVADAEAYVVVTPEYNRSYPASLKQAVDYAYEEWRTKPVGFVSYGYKARGLYAVEHLRQVFAELHTVTMRDAVALDLAAETVPDAQDADALLDQLTWWGLALREARASRPYVA